MTFLTVKVNKRDAFSGFITFIRGVSTAFFRRGLKNQRKHAKLLTAKRYYIPSQRPAKLAFAQPDIVDRWCFTASVSILCGLPNAAFPLIWLYLLIQKRSSIVERESMEFDVLIVGAGPAG
ncbi:hypothetical protein, partial [Litorivivens sp.]|uniref:hypothetical protein n=1 Tax=Litorivivens sp. TaxID=2020868 RepID=UPI0035623817